jgi:hypothetical protein
MNPCSPTSDPAVTVNIYASGLLDELLHDAIAPFWAQVQKVSRDANCYLWVMRYARGGEHLKVRLHGSPEAANSLRPLLFEHAERFLENARRLSPGATRRENPKSPPIDLEDKAETPFPDLSIIGTTYGRTYVSFPASPWLEDDQLIGLASQCLAATTSIFMAKLMEHGPLSENQRQSLLAKTLVRALRLLGWGDHSSAAEYLAFHRDWLLRFFIPESAKELSLRNRFDVQANQGVAQETLARFIEQEWGEGGGSYEDTPWLQTLSRLGAYAESFQSHGDYQIDPFTRNVTFPPVFKMFHGMANQFGVPPLHEAYVHHLLIATLGNRRSWASNELAIA